MYKSRTVFRTCTLTCHHRVRLRRFVLVRVQRTATESSSKMILNIVPSIKASECEFCQSAKCKSGCRKGAGVCAGSRRGFWVPASELRLESKLKSGSAEFQARNRPPRPSVTQLAGVLVIVDAHGWLRGRVRRCKVVRVARRRTWGVNSARRRPCG